MGGYPTSLTLQDIKIIEAGLGYVSRDSTTVEELGPVHLDETLAHCALSANRRPKLAVHTQNLSRWATSNDTLGRLWESQFAWGVVNTFGDGFTELKKLLVFHKSFEWLGERNFRLIGVQNVLGEYVATTASWQSGSCVQLGYHASTAEELLNALKNGGGATFFFPDDKCRPDLIFFLLEEEFGKIVEVHVQSKFTSGTNGAVRSGTFKDAVESLDLDKVYMQFNRKVRVPRPFLSTWICPGIAIHDTYTCFHFFYVGEEVCFRDLSWPRDSPRTREDAARETRRLRTT